MDYMAVDGHSEAGYEQKDEQKDELVKFCEFCGIPTKNEQGYCDSCLYHSNEGNRVCACGDPSKKWLCKKEGPNVGKYFFTCAKDMDAAGRCNFYELEDGPKWVAPPVAEKKCFCGNSCVIQVTRKSTKKENVGRKFLTCARGKQKGGCDYFCWVSARQTKMDKLRGARAESQI